MNVLENEMKKNQYKIENLEYHINNFVNIQVKTSTIYNYKYALNKFLKWINKNSDINEIGYYNVEQTINEFKAYLLNKETLSSSTIDNYILRIQSFFSYLNLQTKIKKLNKSSGSSYKYLTLQEIKLLLCNVQKSTNNNEIIKRNESIILLLFTSGLRATELINIETTDYKQEDNYYIVSITGKGRAKDERENIAIPFITSKRINQYLELKKNNSKYLFSNNHDNKLTRQMIGKIIKETARVTDKINNTNICERATPHSLRHSLARYLLIDKQTPINQVKDILRHKDIGTTIKYLTTSEQEIRDIRTSINF